MWLISTLVIAVVGYLVSGREIPSELTQQLQVLVPDDSFPAARDLALSFIVGMVVAGTPLNTLLRYLSTVVHELGHAFTAGFLGGNPRSVVISLDSSGRAEYHPPADWGRLRATVVSFAGYPAPAIASVAAVQASLSGHPKAWFAFAAGTLALSILFLIRNFWGFLWTAAVVIGSYFAARELAVEIIGLIVGAAAGYLAVEAYRNARTQLSLIRRAPGLGCDAEQIAFWWRFSPRFAGLLHLLVVISISAYATYLAVNPYWSEIYNWIQNFVKT